MLSLVVVVAQSPQHARRDSIRSRSTYNHEFSEPSRASFVQQPSSLTLHSGWTESETSFPTSV